jgi:hypothetical protein
MKLGWTEGSNLQIDYRWTVGGDDELRRYAEELVTLAPDVIMGTGSPPVGGIATSDPNSTNRIRTGC